MLFAVSACDRPPQAPALRDTPVYQNRREGFRFLVPDGWIQTANANLPSGTLTGQSFLVSYRMNTPEQGAELMVACMDDEYTEDLQEHHSEPSYGVQRWEVVQPQTTVEVNGTAAQRMVYKANVSNRPMIKEVTCFEANGRIYSFIGLHWATDEMAAQQIERAIESIVW